MPNEDLPSATSEPTLSPTLQGLMGTFLEDYKAGGLPPDIQLRLDDARHRLEDNVTNRGQEAQEQLKDWAGDFKNTVVDTATEWIRHHPDVAALNGVNPDDPGSLAALGKLGGIDPTVEDIGSMREMLHKAIDLEPVVLDFVQDVVHDVIDSTREVISVRVDSDGSGALEVQAAQANAELDVVEATFDQEIEARRDEVGKAHRAVDDAIDYLEANPQALPYIKETRAMADDLNAVTPDASVIEHEA